MIPIHGGFYWVRLRAVSDPQVAFVIGRDEQSRPPFPPGRAKFAGYVMLCGCERISPDEFHREYPDAIWSEKLEPPNQKQGTGSRQVGAEHGRQERSWNY